MNVMSTNIKINLLNTAYNNKINLLKGQVILNKMAQKLFFISVNDLVNK